MNKKVTKLKHFRDCKLAKEETETFLLPAIQQKFITVELLQNSAYQFCSGKLIELKFCVLLQFVCFA